MARYATRPLNKFNTAQLDTERKAVDRQSMRIELTRSSRITAGQYYTYLSSAGFLDVALFQSPELVAVFRHKARHRPDLIAKIEKLSRRGQQSWIDRVRKGQSVSPLASAHLYPDLPYIAPLISRSAFSSVSHRVPFT